MSIQELKDTIVNSAGASRIAVGSVCHTDSAKAYKKLDSEEPLPCLYNGALGGPSFAHLKLAHSNVRHKPPHPEFTRKFKLKIFDGRQWVEEIRVGGTQKLDGFFATFRREVGKRPINTTGLLLLRLRQWRHNFMSECAPFSFCIGFPLRMLFKSLRKCASLSVLPLAP